MREEGGFTTELGMSFNGVRNITFLISCPQLADGRVVCPVISFLTGYYTLGSYTPALRTYYVSSKSVAFFFLLLLHIAKL